MIAAAKASKTTCYAWLCVALLWVVWLLNYLDRQVIFAVFPLLQAELKLDAVQLIVERVCSKVKRRHGGDQRERGVGSGLLVTEKQFRRIQGNKQIPVLLRELVTKPSSKPGVVKRKKAS